MKKTYSKPALFAESFELSEHIALCSGFSGDHSTINHWGNSTCHFITPEGLYLFYSSVSTCSDEKYNDPNEVFVKCYNTPSDGIGHPFGS